MSRFRPQATIKTVKNGYPYNGLENVMSPNILWQRAKMAKGGVVGTGGKAVISFRFDDYQNIYNDDIAHLMIDRSLPASMALISRFNTEQPWGRETTWDDVRYWNRNGLEIWSHGTDHKDYVLDGYAGLYREIVTSKEEIEEQNIKCVGWAKPGTTPLTSEVPYNGLNRLSEYNSDAGRLLIQTYPITEANAVGSKRPLPNGLFHGLSHVTISDGMAFGTALDQIKQAIRYKVGVEVMIHAGQLGLGNNMTLAQFEEFLDAVVEARDSGQIEVLTPSSLAFADKNVDGRLNIVADGDFKNVTAEEPGYWNFIGSNGIAIKKNENEGYLEFPETTRLVRQYIPNLRTLGVSGEVFEFKGWVRSNGTNSTAIAKVRDYADSSNLEVVRTKPAGSEWELLRFCFCVPPNTNSIYLEFGRNAGNGVDWKSISISIV